MNSKPDRLPSTDSVLEHGTWQRLMQYLVDAEDFAASIKICIELGLGEPFLVEISGFLSSAINNVDVIVDVEMAVTAL